MLLGGLFTCLLSPALRTTVLSQICLIFTPSSAVSSLLAVVRDPSKGAVVADNDWESPGCWTEEQSCQVGCSRSVLKKYRLSWWPGSTAGLVTAPHWLQPHSGLAGICCSHKSCMGEGCWVFFFLFFAAPWK